MYLCVTYRNKQEHVSTSKLSKNSKTYLHARTWLHITEKVDHVELSPYIHTAPVTVYGRGVWKLHTRIRTYHECHIHYEFHTGPKGSCDHKRPEGDTAPRDPDVDGGSG